MAQETIDKIINIQFRYKELVEGIRLTRENIQVLNENVGQYKNQIKAIEKEIESARKVFLDSNSTNGERIKAQETLIRLSKELRTAEEGLKKAERESIAQKKALQETERQYTKELQNNIKIETQASGSLNQLRANVSKLTAQYNALSAEAREGDMGKRLAADIKSQQEAINEAEMSLGNYRSQVGSYKDSILQALGMNQQFTKSISLMKAPLGALLGVIGAVVGVVKLFKSSIHETQSTGDAFDKEMAGWRNTWDLFKKSVSAVDFSVFIRNAAEAREAGIKLQEILDELFERTNSISLQRASMAKENAELEEALRNTGLSYEKRLEAGEKYLANMKDIYAQEQKSAEDVRDAELENLFALTKTREYSSKEEREAAKQAFADGIKNYNLDLDKIRAANEYLDAQKKTKQAYDDISASGAGAIMAAKSATAAKEKEAKSYENFVKTVQRVDESYEQAEERAKGILAFQEQYLLTNDEQVTRYVKAEEKALNAQAASYNNQKRIVNTINSVRSEQTKEYIQNKDKELKASKQAAKTQLDLEKQLSKSILELRQASLEKDLELSRLRFSWERQELENKLKYDKTLTAESREAINKLILNMEERRYKEESEIRQRWNDKEFEEEARNAENRIKMRFNAQNKLQTIRQKEAQLSNYDILHTSDPNKAIEKNAAKMNIAQQQMDAAQSKLSEIQSMSEETYTALYGGVLEWRNAELDAQKAVAEAKQQVNDIQLQGIKLQEKETQMSIKSAQQMVGALEELAEAAGADAGVVAMLAIAESAAAMGTALHKAFSSSATVWDGIAGAVAAISTITTVISQIKSLNSSAADEQKKYRYASGGLVTGPGTGTSDSIPAMLSNGEAVMTAQAVNDWGAMLSAMNVASGGNAIQVSNLPQRNDGMRGMKAMIREAMLEMPAPIVSVVDINKGQKRVKVQNSLGKLGRKKYS